MQPYSDISLCGTCLHRDDRALEPLVHVEHVCQVPGALVHHVVAQQHREGLVADVGAGHTAPRDRVRRGVPWRT